MREPQDGTESRDGVLAVPESRRDGLRGLLDRLDLADRIVLTTHVNADGDGSGCEAAMAAWLAGRGKQVWIINPTPFPDEFRFLLDPSTEVPDLASREAKHGIRTADLLLVLDTGEPNRIGRMQKHLKRLPVAILDHHPESKDGIKGVGLLDPTACATGELVHDLLIVAHEKEHGPGGSPVADWPTPVLEGIYTALVTDTGSFRFSNTTARTHRMVAGLLEAGVDPEAIYRRIYATASLSQLHLLRIALSNLEVDPDLPLTWTGVGRDAIEELSATSRDFEGVVEQVRSVRGTEIALLFREVSGGGTKISLRSNGEADVNAIARRFGGGGHVKAAGAVVGAPLQEAMEQVLPIAREALRRLKIPS